MKNFLLVIIFFFINTGAFSQQKILESNDAIIKILSHIGFPNQELQDSSVSCIVYAIIYHDKVGEIDSIFTSTKNVFGMHIKKSLLQTNKYWKIKGKNKKLPIVIPFIFLGINDSMILPKVLGLNDWINQNNIINCLFFSPVLILGYPKIS